MGFAADLAEDGEQALALLGRTRTRRLRRHPDARHGRDRGARARGGAQIPTRFFIHERRPAARRRRPLHPRRAAEFIAKAVDLSRIEELLRNVASEASSARPVIIPGAGGLEFDRMWERAASSSNCSRAWGRSAGSDAPVLLLGHAGWRKELIARSIPRPGRAHGPFVAVNIPAIPRDLPGGGAVRHEKGAFTGAESAARGAGRRDGRHPLPRRDRRHPPRPAGQAAARSPGAGIRPRGLHTSQGVPRGIIAATNRDLRKMVADGRFRETSSTG